MPKFGLLEIDEAASFGVASVLRGEGKVYFESLFSGRHIGRVSDLLCAQLQHMPEQELRFRIALAAGVLESVKRISGVKNQPILLECGVDPEKVALAVAFECEIEGEDESSWLQVFGEKSAVTLRSLGDASDALIVRGETLHGSHRKIELVCLLGLPGVPIASELESESKVHFLVIQATNANKSSEEGTPPKEYVSLSRLDFQKLLEPEESNEVRIPSSKPQVEEKHETIISAEENQKDEESHFRSDLKQTEETSRFKGNLREKEETEHFTSDLKRRDEIAHFTTDLKQEKEEIIHIEGERAPEEMVSHLEGATERIETNQRLVIRSSGKKGSWLKRMGEAIFGSGEEEDESELSATPPPVAEKAPEPKEIPVSETESLPPESEDIADEDVPKQIDKAIAAKMPSMEIPEENEASASVPLDALVEDIESGQMGDFVSRIQKHWSVMKTDVKDARAAKFVEDMVSEITSERNRLLEQVKQVNISLVKKEKEILMKEKFYQDEVSRRDDIIRQRVATLQAAKDQISKLNSQLQRAQSNQKASAAEAVLRRKISAIERSVQTVKQEKAAFGRQLEQAKVSLMAANAQIAALTQTAAHETVVTGHTSGGGGASSDLVQSMQEKMQKTQKQLDELKRMNRTLQDRLNETEKGKAAAANSGKMEEMKTKLAQATKQAERSKNDAETYRKKLGEAEAEKTKLKKELMDLQTVVRTLQQEVAHKRGGNAA